MNWDLEMKFGKYRGNTWQQVWDMSEKAKDYLIWWANQPIQSTEPKWIKLDEARKKAILERASGIGKAPAKKSPTSDVILLPEIITALKTINMKLDILVSRAGVDAVSDKVQTVMEDFCGTVTGSDNGYIGGEKIQWDE